MSILDRLLRRHQDGGEGYVYVAEGEDGPMRGARAGVTVRIAGEGPPWIVVDRKLEGVVVARWPGRLWRVRILAMATAAAQAAVGGAPLDSAGYARAAAVAVLREEDAATLFGPHGAAVAGVLARAMALTKDEAARLAAARQQGASAAYERVFRRWAKGAGLDAGGARLDGVLKFGGAAPGAPVNNGLAVLNRLVFERALGIDGEAAEARDGEAVWLAAPWDGAERALAEAMLALGAPEFVAEEEERKALLGAYGRVFG